MKFTVSKSEFLPALAKLAKVAESKTTIPVLSNVRIVANGENLTLTATDLDVSLMTQCAAEIKSPGVICLPSKKLHDIFKSISDGEADISVEGEQATIKAGRSRFKMMGFAEDRFPDIPTPPTEMISIPAPSLHSALSSVAFAITTEESRYALNGARLEIHKNKLRAVATDGHRLALIDVAGEFGQTAEILIPRKTVLELISLLASEPEQVEFAHDANQMHFRIGKDVLTSRMLTGQFPNYDLVIPKDHPYTARIEAAALLSSLRRVGLMADANSRSVRIELTPTDLSIFAESADTGSAEESFPITCDSPEPVKFAVNLGYLTDFLSRMDGDVRLWIKDGSAALMFKPADRGDYSYILMPLRL